jgi:hypothetical protein
VSSRCIGHGNRFEHRLGQPRPAGPEFGKSVLGGSRRIARVTRGHRQAALWRGVEQCPLGPARPSNGSPAPATARPAGSASTRPPTVRRQQDSRLTSPAIWTRPGRRNRAPANRCTRAARQQSAARPRTRCRGREPAAARRRRCRSAGIAPGPRKPQPGLRQRDPGGQALDVADFGGRAGSWHGVACAFT